MNASPRPEPNALEWERFAHDVLDICIAAHRIMDARGYLPAPSATAPVDNRSAA